MSTPLTNAVSMSSGISLKSLAEQVAALTTLLAEKSAQPTPPAKGKAKAEPKPKAEKVAKSVPKAGISKAEPFTDNKGKVHEMWALSDGTHAFNAGAFKTLTAIDAVLSDPEGAAKLADTLRKLLAE